MHIKWLGHACFLLQSADGTKVLTDPFDETVGYPLPNRKVDVVTVSHQHFDHNAVGLLPGDPQVVEGPGKHQHKGISFTGIATFHDEKEGALRGENTVFVMEMDGVRIAHLGDLGHILSDEQVKSLGKIDVLLIPVGGTFTLNAEQARETVKQLQPGVTLPMHYKTEYLDFPITPVDDFTQHFQDVTTAPDLRIEGPVAAGSEPKIIVLELAFGSQPEK